MRDSPQAQNDPAGTRKEEGLMYNYFEEVKQAVEDVVNDEAYYLSVEALQPFNLDDYENMLRDALWVEDAVTGNASGSFFCNRSRAEEALADNWNLAAEALGEFGCDDTDIFEKGAEWVDVMIRCYILDSCISDYIDENSFEIEAKIERLNG